jgi:alanyl-tRNA synthetase
MDRWTSSGLRQAFIAFFVERGHRHMPSASLVPREISTTLFTIAGMEPFVPAFLGEEPAPAKRAVSVQRCLRVAGAKSDIENVGRTGRHGTFLEMLGNFGFADYGKREAILWAWEFVTDRIGLEPERLHVTVHTSDDEAQTIWEREIGIPRERITRFDEENFWTMGPMGPCGPCSELFYDIGAAHALDERDTGPNLGNRYVEIWNLVFQQYNREADGALRLLSFLNIDTGAGLERVLAVANGRASIYETDLFTDLLDAQPPIGATSLHPSEVLIRRRIVADHARAVTALIADGVSPSNLDRGYVLRFLIRRAIRNGRLLGYPAGFLTGLVPTVVRSLRSGFPELSAAAERVTLALGREEEAFERTLARGETRLASRISELLDHGVRELPGADAFSLHDTFGFPIELTREILHEQGFTVEPGGFEREMKEQRERARRDTAAKRQSVTISGSARSGHRSLFAGYGGLEADGVVLEILREDGTPVDEAIAGERVRIILDRTSFYAEKGGQIGDHGRLIGGSALFVVDDTQHLADAIVHHGELREGIVTRGAELHAVVDSAWREEIRRHHTSAHLLQYALREVLGESVVQAGSWVGPSRARFDFRVGGGALSEVQRGAVSAIVNRIIREDAPVTTEEMPIADALREGALSMAGESYGEMVRVLRAGPSIELCGGTHAHRTGELGLFIIVSESGIGSGVRRIEALVSTAAERYVAKQQEIVSGLSLALAVKPEEVATRVERLQGEVKELEREIGLWRNRAVAGEAERLLERAEDIGGVTFIAAESGLDGPGLKALANALRGRTEGSIVIAVAGRTKAATSLLVIASEAAVKRGAHAGSLFMLALPHIEGKGGGNAAQAQGNGRKPEGLVAAFASMRDALAESIVR